MKGVSSSPPFTCGSRRSLLSRTDAVLQAEIRQRVGRTDRMKEASSRRTAGFSFSSYKLQKDTTSTTTQFVGWIVEHLSFFVEWRMSPAVRLWTSSDRHTPGSCTEGSVNRACVIPLKLFKALLQHRSRPLCPSVASVCFKHLSFHHFNTRG